MDRAAELHREAARHDADAAHHLGEAADHAGRAEHFRQKGDLERARLEEIEQHVAERCERKALERAVACRREAYDLCRPSDLFGLVGAITARVCA